MAPPTLFTEPDLASPTANTPGTFGCPGRENCLVRVDWQGNAQSVLANDGYAANPYRAEDCCGVMLEIIAFFVTLRAEARVVPAGPSGRGIRLHSVIPIGAATPTRLVGTTLRLRHPQSPTTHASTSVQPCEHSF
jgi:hypothetical protein